jgi:hypothetical protein
MDSKPSAETAAIEDDKHGNESSDVVVEMDDEGKPEEGLDSAESAEDVEGLDGLEGEVSMEGLDDDDGSNEVIMSDPIDGPPHEGKRVKVSNKIPFCCCSCLTRAFFLDVHPIVTAYPKSLLPSSSALSLS